MNRSNFIRLKTDKIQNSLILSVCRPKELDFLNHVEKK